MGKILKWNRHADLAIRKTCGVKREEYLDDMTFRTNRRPLFTEIFGPIIGLKEEWEVQGATLEELDFSAFRYRCEGRRHIPVTTGWVGGETVWILEEIDVHVIALDARGRRMKLIKGFASIPLPMDYPVRNLDDWRRIKHRYEFSEDRFGKDWERVAREDQAEGYVITVSIPGGFDESRQHLGEEIVCLAFCDQLKLIHDILQTIGDTAFRVLDRVSQTVQVDMLTIHEDMAGKSGPLVGPFQIAEFIKPYYRRVWDMLVERGARLFGQDSDGNMNSVLESFLDAGVNVMHPNEPAAGMDMVRIRERFGNRLALYGGIDKHVIRRSREEIVDELEYKIPPMVKSGGCCLALDHRIPNGTPLDNYRFYINKAWEIMDREAALL